MWYHRVIGQGRCPIVDTWWQTETGAILIAPLPGVTATKPGSCTLPLPGIDADIVDDHGNSVKRPDAGGYLVIRKRSEERRVGKEWRSRWSPYHYKKKTTAATLPITSPTALIMLGFL